MTFNENQLKAINTINGNVCVLASAGSGKSSVLVERIKNMIENHNISPENILAITFSRKAKESMVEKLSKITNRYKDVNITTFHSLALKIIQSVKRVEVWDTTWKKTSTITSICKDKGIYSTEEDIPMNDIFRMISIAKNEMCCPNKKMYKNFSFNISVDDFNIIYDNYEKYKSDNNLIEYDDFLNVACEILENDLDLLESYQNRFQYRLSDEYQDTSKNKAKLIDLLGRKNNNIFVVGDFLQNIYSSFTGSNNAYICNFKKDYNAEVINLNINYRCSENIVKISNDFAKTIPETKHPNYIESVAANSSFKDVEFTECEDVESECKFVIDKIQNLIKQEYGYIDIAILARTNAMLQQFELHLNNSKIPYSMSNGISFIEEPEIKLVLSYLKLANDEYDNDSFEYIYNKPNRWLAKQFLEEVKSKCTMKNNSYYQNMNRIDRRNWRFKNGIDEIYDIVNTLENKKFKNIADEVRYLRNRLNIDDFIANKNLSKDKAEIADNLESFEDICKNYTNLESLISYLRQLETNNKKTNTNNKVNLMTIHKSKGLEFPIVFIVGCNENYLPHKKSIDIDEERRLFYVGMTRTEKELYLSSANYRQGAINPISRFINNIQINSNYLTKNT